MSYNTDTPGMSYALSELGVQGNPDLAIVDASRVRGGGWSVSAMTDRDGIPTDLRKQDVTHCYVQATGITYVLRGGITNDKWQILSSGGSTGLAVGHFLADAPGQVGQALQISLPDDLFVTASGLTWSVDSVRGLPDGLTFQSGPGTRYISGSPTKAGYYTIVVNGVDSAGHKAQYVYPLYIAVAVSSAPTTVGSAALNIVMPDSTSECSIVLTTPGYSETGQECFAVANPNRRFIGGSDVENCLAVGSYGYTTVPGGIGYFSFAWGLNIFRQRYPLATTAAFDVYVHPSAVDPAYVNQVNYSYYLSSGLQHVTLNNGLDYAYRDQNGSTGGNWRYNAGVGIGQQNTSADLHQQFTITGLVKKKIGTMSINLVTGVSLFQPVGSVPAPVVANHWGNQGVSAMGTQTLQVPANVFSSSVALTLSATLAGGANFPAGMSFTPGNRSFTFTDAVANADYPVVITATDPYGQSITEADTITLSRPAAPALVAAWGNQSVTTNGDQTLPMPGNTFSSNFALTFSAVLLGTQSLPLGISINAATGAVTIGAQVPNGTYNLTETATDPYNRSAVNNNVFYVNRPASNNPGGNQATSATSQTGSNETPGDTYTSQSGNDGSVTS